MDADEEGNYSSKKKIKLIFKNGFNYHYKFDRSKEILKMQEANG
jgi:hypothetical protein